MCLQRASRVHRLAEGPASDVLRQQIIRTLLHTLCLPCTHPAYPAHAAAHPAHAAAYPLKCCARTSQCTHNRTVHGNTQLSALAGVHARGSLRSVHLLKNCGFSPSRYPIRLSMIAVSDRCLSQEALEFLGCSDLKSVFPCEQGVPRCVLFAVT